MNKFIKGDIISHQFRKRGLYLVIGSQEKATETTYKVVRVKKQATWPLAGTRSTLISREIHMTKVDHAPNHASKSEDEIIREKSDVRSNTYTASAEAQRQVASDSPLDKKHVAKFLEIACALSPENLSCDGELSLSMVSSKRGRLNKRWKMLEGAVGRRVSEEEIWKASENVQA